MRKIQTGFTLIELVVVITILGILAAFAIPRFANLDTQARISAISGLAGTLHSAAALAHAQYLASGTAPSTVTMEGVTVTLANGYPDVAGIQNAVQDTTGFTPTVSGSSITYSKAGGSSSANCSIQYTAASAAGSAPAIPAPTTSGC